MDWLDRGISEMLTTNLAQVQGMDVISTEKVFAALQGMGKKPNEIAGISSELARRAGAGSFVSGALMKVGSRLRLDVRVQDTNDGQILFSGKLEGDDLNSVFGMVDSLTSRIAERFLPPSAVPEKAPAIEEASTANIEAYRRYEIGRDYCNRFLTEQAIPELQQAVNLDPKFGAAWVELAGAYGQQGNLSRADEIRHRLTGLQSRLPRRDRLIVQAAIASTSGDPKAAEKQIRAPLAEYPRESGMRITLASLLGAQQRHEESIAVLNDGLALNARDELLLNNLCYEHIKTGNTAAALEANDRYQAVRPGDPNPWDTRGDIYFAAGKWEEARSAYQKVLDLRPDFQGYTDFVKSALILSAQRKYAEADAQIAEFRDKAGAFGKLYAPVFRAQLLQERGDPESARDAYREAVEQFASSGDPSSAAVVLQSYAIVSAHLGDTAEGLKFARAQKLGGRELQPTAILLGLSGNAHEALKDLDAYRSAQPDVPEETVRQLRLAVEAASSISKRDGKGALSAVEKVGFSDSPGLELLRGRAQLLLHDPVSAAASFQRVLSTGNMISNINTLHSRAPLGLLLARYYLGVAHELSGDRGQALEAYREFLSHFENSKTKLRQVAEARAAIRRLS